MPRRDKIKPWIQTSMCLVWQLGALIIYFVKLIENNSCIFGGQELVASFKMKMM